MRSVLDILGGVPVTKGVIASLYPNLSNVNQKVALLERNGHILRLKRGLYIANPTVSGQRVSTELVANHLYSPSYVSMHSALSWYGLIPERVYLMQSMTLKHSRRFENAFGVFEYIGVSRDYFPIGVQQQEAESGAFIIASPEKALCDLVYATSGVNLRHKREAQAFLEEDLRVDMKDLQNFDLSILKQCADTGKKRQSLENIIKLLQK